MKFSKKHNSDDNSFWLSATDMMAGILIVVLLLLMLFLLYLNNSTDEVFTPLKESENPTFETQAKVPEFETTKQELFPTQHQGQQSETQQQNQQAAPTEGATESEYDGFDSDEFEKAAVLVNVVDADSGTPIKKSGIEFELYSNHNGTGSLQMLSLYYQERIEFRSYETGENGTFYLPEKIKHGSYTLHNLKAPEGYYPKDETVFEVHDNWEWSKPYKVTVYLTPIKKNIRVMAEDSITSEGLKDVTFKILAGENIYASDDTLLYKSGETVEKIKTDDTGYAETKELNIGKYIVKQVDVPNYYAIDTKTVSVTLKGGTDESSSLVEIGMRKSAVIIKLSDVRTGDPIPGAKYTLEGREDFTTDVNGEFIVTDLDKSKSYELKTKSIPNDYIKKSNSLRFKVDEKGLIDDEVEHTIHESAYTITLRVDVKDQIFGRASKGVDLQLLNEKEVVVDEWTTNNQTHISSGLKEGDYYVQRAGDENSRIPVHIIDTPDLQLVDMKIWDTIDLFAILMVAGFVIIGGFVIVVLVNRKKKKVKPKHE